jgi:hypothetical protein
MADIDQGTAERWIRAGSALAEDRGAGASVGV